MKYLIFFGLLVLGQYSVAQTNTPTKPLEPVYEVCSTAIDYQACDTRNQKIQREYSIQLSDYNNKVQASQQLAQSEAQRKLAEQEQLASTKAAAEAAQNKNQKSASTYSLASMLHAAASAYYAALFAASCPKCQGELLAKSIFHAAQSGAGASQASSNNGVAYKACATSNQFSTGGVNCGPPPSQYNPKSYPSNQTAALAAMFDENGKCIGSAEDCAAVIKNLPVGSNIKDILKGMKSFATTSPFKVNEDGSLTTKDGKTYTAANFASVKDMMAAGMSEADAKNLFAELNKNSALDAKTALAKENKPAAGMADSSSTGTTKDKGVILNGSASEGKDIGTKRNMASVEGLARDFNGDMIGVAGDDIFKMMNRRYKLKTSQDNFIAAP